jgi:putative MATE family efflux protein
MGFNYFIRAEGRPDHAMFTLIIGAVLNIILDWLFIIVLSMGIAGAALATVIAQMAASLWAASFYFRRRGNVRIYVRSLFPKWEILRRILVIGASPFLMEITFTFILILMNRVISAYGGDLAISAVGIFFSLDSLLFLPVLGIGEGLQPLVGYNYGAKVYARVIHAVKLALWGAIGFFLLSFTIIMVVPEPLVHLFNTTNNELISMTVRGMRLGYMGLPMVAIAIIGSFTLQALGKARESLILNLARQFLFFIPSLVFLPKFIGLDGVWLSLPVADVLGGLLGGIILKREIKKMRKKEKDLFKRISETEGEELRKTGN